MPLYEFECLTCGFRVERLEWLPNPVVPECPRCLAEHEAHRPMLKLVSASHPHFKGEGWSRPSTYTPPMRGPKGGD